jgi:hypothetical protein
MLGFNICPASLLIWYYDYLYGNCFRVNTGYDTNGQAVEVHTQRESDFLYGIRLSFLVGLPGGDEFNSFFNQYSTNGGLVAIDNQNDIALRDSTLIRVKPGTCAYIVLKKQVAVSLPAPFSNCATDETYTGRFKQEFRDMRLKYSKRACLQFCKTMIINEKCQCRNNYFSIINSDFVRYCINETEYRCSIGVFKNHETSTSCDEIW